MTTRSPTPATRRHPRQRRGDRPGYALVTVLTLVLVLGALVAAYFALTSIDLQTTRTAASATTAFYAAEAGLNLRGQAIRTTFEGRNRPAGTSPDGTDVDPEDYRACTDAGTGNDGTLDFACQTFRVSAKDVLTYVVEEPGNPRRIQIEAGEDFQGLSALEYAYRTYAVATGDEDQPEAILGLSFRSRVVPLFQFAAFYDKDLEIANGPELILSGPIHVNGNLYLNSGTEQYDLGQITVSRADGGSGGGDLFRGLKRAAAGSAGACTGEVRIAAVDGITSATLFPVDDAATPRLDCKPDHTDAFGDAELATWGDQIKTGLDYINVPDPGEFNYGGLYWNDADLRVGLDIRNPAQPLVAVYRAALGIDGLPQIDAARTRLLQNCSYDSLYGAGFVPPLPAYDYAQNEFINVTPGELNADSPWNETLWELLAGGGSAPIPVTELPDPVAADPLLDPTRRRVVEASNTFLNNREILSPNTVNSRTKNYTPGSDADTVMLEVDAQGLLDCIHRYPDLLGAGSAGPIAGLSDTTEGGLVWFLTVVGPLSAEGCAGNPGTHCINNYGVRVWNGAQLEALAAGAPAIDGLTVASDQAVYSHGDYNRDTGAGDDWYPSAFIADSYNLLSNAWNDAAVGPATGPFATATTVNAALLSGTDVTNDAEGAFGGGGTLYNGGLENYPRFHEDWGGITLRYRGSFVSLELPEHVHGRWNLQTYDPPNRDWGYDERFNDYDDLPPLSPVFVYLRQVLFERSFEQYGATP